MLFRSEDYDLKDIVYTNKNKRYCFAGTDGTFIYGYKADNSIVIKYTIPSGIVVKDLTALMDYEDQYISFRDGNTNLIYLIDQTGKICKGFPTTGYGSTKDVATTRLEFIFKSGTNSFSLYQID